MGTIHFNGALVGVENLQDIKLMIATLENEGAHDLARRMDDSITYVVTSTEMFIEVVEVLDLVKTSKVSQITKAKALKLQKDILAYINLEQK